MGAVRPQLRILDSNVHHGWTYDSAMQRQCTVCYVAYGAWYWCHDKCSRVYCYSCRTPAGCASCDEEARHGP